MSACHAPTSGHTRIRHRTAPYGTIRQSYGTIRHPYCTHTACIREYKPPCLADAAEADKAPGRGGAAGPARPGPVAPPAGGPLPPPGPPGRASLTWRAAAPGPVQPNMPQGDTALYGTILHYTAPNCSHTGPFGAGSAPAQQLLSPTAHSKPSWYRCRY